MRGYKTETDRVAFESIGYRIRYFRLQAGLTQKELADQCHLHESTIRNYELGNRIPNVDRINAIADALGISPYALSIYDREDLDCSIQILFQLETLISLQPEGVDEQSGLVTERLPGFIEEWKHKKALLEEGQISEEEYLKWQAGYHYQLEDMK